MKSIQWYSKPQWWTSKTSTIDSLERWPCCSAISRLDVFWHAPSWATQLFCLYCIQQSVYDYVTMVRRHVALLILRVSISLVKFHKATAVEKTCLQVKIGFNTDVIIHTSKQQVKLRQCKNGAITLQGQYSWSRQYAGRSLRPLLDSKVFLVRADVKIKRKNTWPYMIPFYPPNVRRAHFH